MGGSRGRRPDGATTENSRYSVVAEPENGKSLAQIAREHDIHPSLPSRWREELAEKPEKAFNGNGNK